MADIKTSVLYVCGKPNMVMMDYMIDSSNDKDGTLNEDSVRYKRKYDKFVLRR